MTDSRTSDDWPDVRWTRNGFYPGGEVDEPRNLADRLEQARTAHLRWPDSTPDDDTLDDLRVAAALLRRHADLVDRIRMYVRAAARLIDGEAHDD